MTTVILKMYLQSQENNKKGINYKSLTRLYVVGSKLPKTAKNCPILRFWTILGVQNDLKGGKFGKKWLLDIKVPVFSYLFHHKKLCQFSQLLQ